MSPFDVHLFAGIIDEQSVLMILDELLRKLNNPCLTAAAAGAFECGGGGSGGAMGGGGGCGASVA